MPKLYKLGKPISLADANRLLGLPVKKPLEWQEFQALSRTQKTKALSTKFDVGEQS